MNIGDAVKFKSDKVSKYWGKFTYGKVYVVQDMAGSCPNLLDDALVSWWINDDTLEVVTSLDVTEGWSL